MIIWDSIQRTLKLMGEETEALLRDQARAEYNALLKEDRAELVLERDMLASATDAALSEAAPATAQLAQLQAQLKAEQQQRNKERYDLSKQLEKARQPSAEVLALQ